MADAPADGQEIPGYVPLWAYPQAQGGTANVDLGPAQAGAAVDLRVYLAGRDPRGLAAYAAAVSDPHSRRVFPDIAADADPWTGVLVGGFSSSGPGQPAAYRESPAGGNSLSVQLIGGMKADAQQAAGTAIGFANPAIYARYAPPSARTPGEPVYHDVTGSPLGAGITPAVALPAAARLNGVQGPFLISLGLDQGPAAAPGYDDVTGVGSPEAGYFTSYSTRQPRI